MDSSAQSETAHQFFTKVAKANMSRPATRTEIADLYDSLLRHKLRWLVPAVGLSMLVAIYALLKEDTWQVSQPIIVRDDTSLRTAKLGEFAVDNPLKVSVETIHEICTSPAVLLTAMKDVGPPPGAIAGQEWPTEKSLERIRSSLSLDPPNGTEFGTTEVFYLRVKDSSRQRAGRLLTAIYERLQERLWEIRHDKLQGLIDELEEIVNIAEANLQHATARVTEMEKAAGEDFVELRMLHDIPNGQGDIVAAIASTESELMRVQTSRQVTEKLQALLQKVADDPNSLLAVPQELISSQPNLAQLTAGLSAAKLRTASLRGSLTPAHPRVAAAELEERITREKIHEELENALGIVAADLQISDGRTNALRQELARLRGRLTRLAELRAGYSNLIYQVEQRAQALEEAQGNLAEVRAKQSANRISSIISRLDEAETGSRPLGPSRIAIISCGIAGGVFVGFGWLLLTTAPVPPGGRPSTGEFRGESRQFATVGKPDQFHASKPAGADGATLHGSYLGAIGNGNGKQAI